MLQIFATQIAELTRQMEECDLDQQTIDMARTLELPEGVDAAEYQALIDRANSDLIDKRVKIVRAMVLIRKMQLAV